MKFPKILQLTILMLSTGATPAFADPVSKTLDLRAQCRKHGYIGCSGNQDKCVSAPSGYLIISQHTSAGIVNHGGRQPRCIMRLQNERDFVVPGAFGGPVKVADGICLHAHIESGTYHGGRGQNFYVDCRATYLIEKPPS